MYANTRKIIDSITQCYKPVEAIVWFANIKMKNEFTFIQLDIGDIYTSITENLLMSVLNLTINYRPFSDLEINIIKQARNLSYSIMDVCGPPKN